MSALPDDKKIAVVLQYFRLADQGRAEVLDLFHEDVELYFLDPDYTGEDAPRFRWGRNRRW